MIDRTPEDVVRGILRIRIGETEREVPTLKMKASAEWVKLAADKLGVGVLHLADDESAMTAFAGLASEVMLDLVVAYDSTSALGGRKWIEDNADPSELYTALRQMGKVALPFVSDLSTFLAAAVRMYPSVVVAAVASVSQNSTSGRSSTGASQGKSSKRASIASS